MTQGRGVSWKQQDNYYTIQILAGGGRAELGWAGCTQSHHINITNRSGDYRASIEHSRSLKLYDHGDEDSPYYGAPYNLFVVDQIQCVLFVG